MIGPEILIHGELLDKPEEREDKRNKFYTVAHILTEVPDGREKFFIISHVSKVSFALQELDAGDQVTLRGALTILRDDGNCSVGISPRRILSLKMGGSA